MKKTQSLNVYVPKSFYLEGKQETPCRRFFEDLAILHPSDGYRILAARGLFLKANNSITLEKKDQAFVQTALRKGERVLAIVRERPLILFGDAWHACGLVLALLPHEELSVVLQTLPHIPNAQTLLAPSAQAFIPHSVTPLKITDFYPILTDQYLECTRILQGETDFRLHIAHIAQYAGTRTNVTELPIGEFALSPHTKQRWSFFLLCLFLALRGDSATPSEFELTHADKKEFHVRFSHTSEAKRKIPLAHSLFLFLSLPCFSDFHFFKTENGFLIEASLPRSTSHPALRATDSAIKLALEILVTTSEPK